MADSVSPWLKVFFTWLKVSATLSATLQHARFMTNYDRNNKSPSIPRYVVSNDDNKKFCTSGLMGIDNTHTHTHTHIY